MAIFILLICTIFFSLLPILYVKKKYNFWDGRKKYIYVSLPTLVLIAMVVVTYYNFSFFQAILILAFAGIMYSVSIIDFKTKTIDTKLTLAMLMVGLISLISTDWIGSLFRFGTAIIVFATMYLLSKVSKGVGFGDVQLIAITALLLEFDVFFATIFYGLIISLIAGIVLMKLAKANMKYELPFAPFIEIGLLLAMFLQVV